MTQRVNGNYRQCRIFFVPDSLNKDLTLHGHFSFLSTLILVTDRAVTNMPTKNHCPLQFLNAFFQLKQKST